MVNELDMSKFQDFRVAVTKRFFEEFDMEEVEFRPNMYVSFLEYDNEDNPLYKGSRDYDEVKKVLEEKLQEYNESNAVMDLVLFQQAIEHITRISRIIDLPRGNAMLVGVGGSGKQSLAKLASYICSYEVVQISVTSSYGVADFKEALLSLYTKAGMKSTPCTFLMTDNQIVKEEFLVFLNDLLATGLITDLFSQEDKDNFCNSVRNECKAAGILDSMENLWDFFIDKVGRPHRPAAACLLACGLHSHRLSRLPLIRRPISRACQQPLLTATPPPHVRCPPRPAQPLVPSPLGPSPSPLLHSGLWVLCTGHP